MSRAPVVPWPVNAVEVVAGAPGGRPRVEIRAGRHENRPPGPGEREIKTRVRAAYGFVVGKLGELQDATDIVEAFYMALPRRVRIEHAREVYGSTTYARDRLTVQEKLEAIWDYRTELDGVAIAENLLIKTVGDKTFGRLRNEAGQAFRRATGRLLTGGPAFGGV